MRVVYEAGHLIDAYLVRHALEEAGFAVFVRGKALLDGLGELPMHGIVAVCVADQHWAQARAILEALPIVVGNGVPSNGMTSNSVAGDRATASPGTGPPVSQWLRPA